MARDAPAEFLVLFHMATEREDARPRTDSFVKSLTGAESAACLGVYTVSSDSSLKDARAKKWSLSIFSTLAQTALDFGEPLFAVRFEALVQTEGTTWRERFVALERTRQQSLAVRATKKQKTLANSQLKFLRLMHMAIRQGHDGDVQQYIDTLGFHEAHGCLLAYLEASLRYAPDNTRSLQIFYGVSTLTIQRADADFLAQYRRLVNEAETTWQLRWARLKSEWRDELERSLAVRAMKVKKLEAGQRQGSTASPRGHASATGRDRRPASETYRKFAELFVKFMNRGMRARPNEKKSEEQRDLETFIFDQKLPGLRDCFASYLNASQSFPPDSELSLYIFWGVASRLINVPEAGCYEALKLDLLTKTRGTIEFQRFTALAQTEFKDRLTSEIAQKVGSRKRLILDDLKFEYYRQYGADADIAKLQRFEPNIDVSYREAMVGAVHECDRNFELRDSHAFAKSFDSWAELLHSHADYTLVFIAMLKWCRETSDVTPLLQSELYWYGVLVLQAAAIKRYPERYGHGLTKEDRDVFLDPGLVPQRYRYDFDRRLEAATWKRQAAPAPIPSRAGQSADQRKRVAGPTELRDVSRGHAVLLLMAAKLGKAANVRFTLVGMDEAERIHNLLEKLKRTKAASLDDIRLPNTSSSGAALRVGQTVGNLYIVWGDPELGYAFVEVEGLGRVLFRVNSYWGLGKIKREDDTYGQIWRDNQHLLVVIPAFFELLGYLPSLVSGGFAELVADVVLDAAANFVAEQTGLPPEASLGIALLAGVVSNQVVQRATASTGTDEGSRALEGVSDAGGKLAIVETKAGLSTASGGQIDASWLDGATAGPKSSKLPVNIVETKARLPASSGGQVDAPWLDGMTARGSRATAGGPWRRSGPATPVDPPPRDPLNGRGLAGVQSPVAYSSVDELRAKVEPLLKSLKSGMSDVNPKWKKVEAAIKIDGPWKVQNAELLADLKKVYEAHRDPDQVLDLIADLWQQAAITHRTTRETLEAHFGDPRRIVIIQPGEELTRDVMAQKAPFLDLDFAQDVHGAHTHMFSELLTARVLGGIEEASKFRRRIAAATTGPKVGPESFWRGVWNALFDDDELGHINHPETLGPILQKHLGLPRWMPPRRPR